VNRIVFDILLVTEDPVLLKDHIDYILNQGLQALLVKESNQNVDERFKTKQLDLWQ
jgi:mRNA deadenylase 3'-5' endonuclease subunit Ccr4